MLFRHILIFLIITLGQNQTPTIFKERLTEANMGSNEQKNPSLMQISVNSQQLHENQV